MPRLPYLVAAGLAPLLVAGGAWACTIDGKASAYANSVRAVVVSTAPTAATYAWWAHFAFPATFRSGQHIAFHEDDAQVRKVLPSQAQHRPWRWTFGDGTAVVGDAVSHSYLHPGHYKVTVSAYFPGANLGWEAFDAITIAVAR